MARKGEKRRRKEGRKDVHLRKVLLHPHELLRIGAASRRYEFIQLNCLSKPQLQHDRLYDTLITEELVLSGDNEKTN
jgi:hypothetical protein